MTQLADWLKTQMHQQGIAQAQLAVRARSAVPDGASSGTLSAILTKNHIPRVEILLRLTDHLGLNRLDALTLAGYLTPADLLPASPPLHPNPDPLLTQLVHHFNRLPDPWKQHAVDYLRSLANLSANPTAPHCTTGAET